MKFSLYIAGLAFIIVSCSTTRNFSSIMEDDIYYVPGKKALAIREVENLTGHDIGTEQPVDPTVLAGEISRSAGSSTPPATFSSSNNTKINARSGQLEQVNIQSLTREAEEKLANNEEIDMTLYENTGYWIGGYRGPASDLAEIQRIINMYPEGFANFSNGQEIALNLSFDSDWNVYTDNGRYWWFPSNTNINLYSSLLFGTYPKYIWTIVWNNPRFDSWAFDATFNNRFNWSLNLGWGGPGWSIGFGWNSGWYDPWYGGWYDPWYRPWYGGYYPGWGYPHWHHPHWGHPGWDYPHWGGGSGHYPNRPNRPHWAGQRPGFGGGVSGIRPNGNRPNSNNGLNRPNSTRPGTGSALRPGTSNSLRPGTGTTTRPGSSTGTINRPGTTRPNTSGINRPTGTTRPNTTTTRPGTITRPNTGSNIRPGTNTSSPSQGGTRPVTRPSTTTRPSNTTNNRYTRPSGSSSSNVKTYNRPQNSYRPTYNNNSSSNYTPRRSSSTTRSSGSSYTPSRSSGSSYSPSRNSSPSRSSGGSSRGTINRPTRR